MPAETSLPDSLEQHRQRLEDSLTQLRKALRDWQTWTTEYEVFREELEQLPANAGREAMLAAGIGFAGQKVDEDEIKDLLGDRAGVKRTRQQVLAAVRHRADYSAENVTKCQKRVDEAEKKLYSLLVVSELDMEVEEGVPLMDIREELDEEGNIINATVNGKDPSATIRDLDTKPLEQFEEFMEDDEPKTETTEEKTQDTTEAPVDVVIEPPLIPPKDPPVQEIRLDEEPKKGESAKETPPRTGQFKEQEGGGYVKVFNDPPEVPAEDWVKEVPGESEEDARLRREMLEYNMQEIGAVVAELNLEEDGDYYGYEYTDGEDEDDDEEDEDEYGRTTRRVVTDTMREEMAELERRINAREAAAKDPLTLGKENEKPKKKGVRFAEELDIAPTPVPTLGRQHTVGTETQSVVKPPDPDDALPFLVDLLGSEMMKNAGPNPTLSPEVNQEPAPVSKAAKEPGKKKESLFKKERVEKANAPAIPAMPTKAPIEKVVPTAALKPDVLERAPETSDVPILPPSQPRKLSRFKAARAAAATEEPVDETTDAPKPTLSNFVVEHEPTKPVNVQPPDELDPILHRQEVNTEYHRLRNKMIQKQGGFIESEEEQAIVPLDENGEKRKVSRFMAARLKGLGP